MVTIITQQTQNKQTQQKISLAKIQKSSHTNSQNVPKHVTMSHK